MIVADSSVWIDFFNGKKTAQTRYLRDRADRHQIAVGDLVLCEVLQGFRRDKDMVATRQLLLSFHNYNMAGQEIAPSAAGNYRKLRAMGITIRKTMDILIATSCITSGFCLLHADADFDPLERLLGLRFIHPECDRRSVVDVEQ